MNIKKLILSCFGVGFLPIAPGTFASLLPLAAFLLIRYYCPVDIVALIFLVLGMIASSVLCLMFAGQAEKLEGKKDPGWIVIDEFAGQSIALLPAALLSGSGKVVASALASVVFFRFLDILKPPPIHEMQQIDGGLGILIDDLVAGIMAGTVLCIIIFLLEFIR
jgi:phosphatidylglycerophosphatase A